MPPGELRLVARDYTLLGDKPHELDFNNEWLGGLD
jgi:hypothetical protein